MKAAANGQHSAKGRNLQLKKYSIPAGRYANAMSAEEKEYVPLKVG
ncbi:MULTISPECIES: hypothetical protein [unclassified Tolypothrix]|nr:MULTISPECIES: hypothetical protein [unclassified Tolypothrix]BAY90340.1 hypothetical protein NIES3275_23520 [Microchaete diplosiphon NIES-3275]EKE98801.1 hypothetical protein FDUTEX481_03718 [Tolypothrix sp. PCC 7601]MBE9083388.1 hypothetical protein [Tolypothrix sp. LEGE 11397]UYD24518.1 hypothetical protein HGR01_24155 [Tolypothrix sp. PCC 7712]UYD33252.1 hypothetical protein HG267_30515 [Tolypothrix sp. PCC 7601]